LLFASTFDVLPCGALEPVEAENQGLAEHKFTNHLIGESSPYLLAHAHNPVDWYPWGEEALQKAETEDKIVFLSIGYASCHWCHVMERESFENEEIAAILNDHFVSIKVDREERPDLDEIHMAFTTSLTGRGGWPMSVFLTPDRKPFFAGTYFPPDDRHGHPGFRKVLTEVAAAYRENRESIMSSATDIVAEVTRVLQRETPKALLGQNMLKMAADQLMKAFDSVNGGFGPAPKFPHALELSSLLRQYRRSGDLALFNAVDKSLGAMARGGLFDQVGGGFARYSTDDRWLVPHFEKMLYDSALLVPVYIEAWQVTGREFYRGVARSTLDFILREMTDTTGGLYSALDADSEGMEGKFYLWSKREIDDVLGDAAPLFCEYFNVTERGNFEGSNILNIDVASDRARQKAGPGDFDGHIDNSLKLLLEARSKRVRPKTDDKILTSWNGLALSALCRGYRVTGDGRYLDAAGRNAEFVKRELWQGDRLTHSYRQGRRSSGEFLEDYAYYIAGLLALCETVPDDDGRRLAFAEELTRRALAQFMDNAGHFYLRPEDGHDLIFRPKSEVDGAMPAPGSIMLHNLLKLSRLTGDQSYLERAEKGLRAVSGLIATGPTAMTSAAPALDYYLADKIEIVIVGEGEVRQKMLSEVHRRFLPNVTTAVSAQGGRAAGPLFAGRESRDGRVRAYVCCNSTCRVPIATAEELGAELGRL
jgi:uncharacterized protein YyaL (SSP411 family)